VWENKPMTGVQFVTDGKGRKVAVLIDLKKHGARLEEFWDGLTCDFSPFVTRSQAFMGAS